MQKARWTLLLPLLLGGLAGCGQGLDGEWSESCDSWLLAPEGAGICHARLETGELALALVPEQDGWLLATGWMLEDFQLVQSTFDAGRLRRAVRTEEGACAGSVCWIEFSDEEVRNWAKKRYFRIELTRVFWNEEGRMRRGTRAFTVPTGALGDWLARDPA